MALTLAFIIAVLVEVVLPIAAVIILLRKKLAPWMTILIGSLMLFTAQSLLIPIYSVISNWLTPVADSAINAWMPIIDGLVLGIIGAVIVEGIRWLGLRFMPNLKRDQSNAIALGLGYGGLETMLFFGIPVLISFINMLVYKNADFNDPTLAEGLVTQVQALWQLPWQTPLVSAVERISGMLMHITLSVVVMQSFIKNQVKFLLFAMGVHVLYEGIPLILLEYRQPTWLIEFFLVAFAVIFVLILIRFGILREFQGKGVTVKTNDLDLEEKEER